MLSFTNVASFIAYCGGRVSACVRVSLSEAMNLGERVMVSDGWNLVGVSVGRSGRRSDLKKEGMAILF